MRIHARHAMAVALVALVVGACRPRADEADAAAAARALDSADAAAVSCTTAAPSCASGELCVFEPGLCGRGKRPGTCRPRPASCDGAPFAPVCGCDGAIHPSACAASAAGVDLDVTGRCRARVVDWMACGAHLCDAHTQYCEIVLSDVFELPTDSICRPLPGACVPDGDAGRGCDCFPAGTRCASFCGFIETAGIRGFHLTCRS